jgi:hypothetical protein
MKYSSSSFKQLRQYGIDDLKAYIKKLKKNIKVFEKAIEKEKSEIKKAKEMIKVLEKDKKTPEEIKINLRS